MNEGIEELSDLSAEYLSKNLNATEQDRETVLQSAVQEFISKVDKNSMDPNLYEIKCAKAFNVCTSFNPDVRDQLFKVLKHEPKLAEAWLELAVCFTKKPDAEAAVECFEQYFALDCCANALFQYSLIIRLQMSQLPAKDTENREKFRIKAEKYALQCVNQYPKYGPGHFSLGNSYLYNFFSVGQRIPELMEKAISSYRKALTCGKEYRNPDLHANLATALRYVIDFNGAVHHLREAIVYEGSSGGSGASLRLLSLTSYLERIMNSIEKTGQKNAKITTQQTKLKPNEALNSLREGTNNRTVSAVVVANIHHDEQVPLTVVAVDKENSVFAVTIFNCTASFGLLIGDIISISDPLLITQEICLSGRAPCILRCIRIKSPATLTRNGIRTRSSNYAPAQLSLLSGH